MNQQQLESGSFRDRKARVFYHKGGVYRVLSKEALSDWDALSATQFFPRLSESGKIIPTEKLNSIDGPEVQPPGHWAGVLKHERVPFISYPYEWSFGMLKDAALLQLELLLVAMKEELGKLGITSEIGGQEVLYHSQTAVYCFGTIYFL